MLRVLYTKKVNTGSISGVPDLLDSKYRCKFSIRIVFCTVNTDTSTTTTKLRTLPGYLYVSAEKLVLEYCHATTSVAYGI